MEIAYGWISAGRFPMPFHGTTTYSNGNISFGANPHNILSGVLSPAGNPLFIYQITFDEPPDPHTYVTFLLYAHGDYRQFSGYTDSLGQFFVWLGDPEDPTDPTDPTDPPDPPILISKEPAPTQGLWLQTGANAGQGLTLYLEAVDALTLGLLDIAGNPAINVMLESGYEISPLLNVLESALTQVNAIRATLGAVQNRLEFTSESLLASGENLSSAESRIRDADMAREMIRFTKAQVLQQAGISMLAQANQLPTAVLQLLQ